MTRPVLWTSLSGRAMEEGMIPRGLTCWFAMAPMAGQSLSFGLLRLKEGGRSLRPDNMTIWPSECSLKGWVMDLQIDQVLLRRARRGRCSQIRIPSVLVAIGLKDPRNSFFASGFMSKLSICDRPPDRKI